MTDQPADYIENYSFDDNAVDNDALYTTLPMVRGAFSKITFSNPGHASVPVPREVREARANLYARYPHTAYNHEPLPKDYLKGSGISFWIESDLFKPQHRAENQEHTTKQLKDFCRALRHRYQMPLKIRLSNPDHTPLPTKGTQFINAILTTDEAHKQQLVATVLPALNHTLEDYVTYSGEQAPTAAILDCLPPERDLQWREQIQRYQQPGPSSAESLAVRDVANFMEDMPKKCGIEDKRVTIYNPSALPLSFFVKNMPESKFSLQEALLFRMKPMHVPKPVPGISDKYVTEAEKIYKGELGAFQTFMRRKMPLTIIPMQGYGFENSYLCVVDAPPHKQAEHIATLYDAIDQLRNPHKTPVTAEAHQR